MIAARASETPVADERLLDEREFRTLVARHEATVNRKLRRLGVPPRDRPDNAQEVFLVIHRKLRGGTDRALLPALVNTVCVRVASTYRRIAYNRHRTTLDAEALQAALQVEADQELAIERRTFEAHVASLLDRLDQQKRTIVLLHDLRENTMADVARELGCPLQTAYSRLKSAHRALRSLCEESDSVSAIASGGPLG